jgi:hypothetical protein
VRRPRADALAGPPGLALAAGEQLLASLDRVDLARRSRRALGIGVSERTVLAVTDRHVLVLAGRGARARVAARYPRDAVRVLEHSTRWPGGEYLVDRIVIRAADATVSVDFDGRQHHAGQAVAQAIASAEHR